MRNKILFLLPYFNIAGTEIHAIELANALKDRFEIKIVAPYGRGVELLPRYDISYSELPLLSLLNHRKYLRILREIILYFKPEIIHVHGAHELTYLVKRSFPSTPVIFTCHGYNSDYPLLDYKLSAFFNNKYSDKVITVSDYERKNLLKAGLSENKLVVIYNGIQESKKRKNLPIKIDGFILGTCARLTKKKGINYLIEAFQRVREKYKDIHLFIIGDGEERKNLEKLVSQNNKNYVHFLGNIPEATSYFSNFHIFVLPSLNESFGIVILEAMSQRIPVIATKVGGIPEIIRDKETGILVAPKDTKVLVEAIIELLENEELRNKIGERGYINYKEKFTLEKMAEKTSKIYEDILFSSSK